MRSLLAIAAAFMLVSSAEAEPTAPAKPTAIGRVGSHGATIPLARIALAEEAGRRCLQQRGASGHELMRVGCRRGPSDERAYLCESYFSCTGKPR